MDQGIILALIWICWVVLLESAPGILNRYCHICAICRAGREAEAVIEHEWGTIHHKGPKGARRFTKDLKK